MNNPKIPKMTMCHCEHHMSIYEAFKHQSDHFLTGLLRDSYHIDLDSEKTNLKPLNSYFSIVNHRKITLLRTIKKSYRMLRHVYRAITLDTLDERGTGVCDIHLCLYLLFSIRYYMDRRAHSQTERRVDRYYKQTEMIDLLLYDIKTIFQRQLKLLTNEMDIDDDIIKIKTINMTLRNIDESFLDRELICKYDNSEAINDIMHELTEHNKSSIIYRIGESNYSFMVSKYMREIRRNCCIVYDSKLANINKLEEEKISNLIDEIHEAMTDKFINISILYALTVSLNQILDRLGETTVIAKQSIYNIDLIVSFLCCLIMRL